VSFIQRKGSPQTPCWSTLYQKCDQLSRNKMGAGALTSCQRELKEEAFSGPYGYATIGADVHPYQ
jgi:hypothetical protein